MVSPQFVKLAPQESAVDALVRELCTAETLNGRYLIQLPVVSAFGSMVSVSVWPEGGGDTFMVSDDGLAHHEISTAAASEATFSRVAAAKCKRYGARFDGGTMLFMRVDRQRLKGAVVAMGSLTKEVIDETLERSFAAKVDANRETFIKRASEAFANFQRTEHAHVFGQSTTEYDIDLLVETDRGALVFDYFSKSGHSINSAYVKLSDIARLDDGPKPIGVTRSLDDIGPKLVLVSSVARVIEAGSDRNTYAKLAA